ncbi:Odorant binding protein, partial [Operophtera brumata]
MVGSAATVLLLALLPTAVFCSGEGNIRLLEEEVAAALKACSEGDHPSRGTHRQKRSADGSPRIDDENKQGSNQYSHERRNMTDVRDQMFIINATDYDYEGYGSGNGGEKLMNSMPKTAESGSYPNVDGNVNNLNRTRRSETLFNKADNDQVDSRGIPREAELWTKVQSSVASQQSRAALRDQIGACFQELQS